MPLGKAHEKLNHFGIMVVYIALCHIFMLLYFFIKNIRAFYSKNLIVNKIGESADLTLVQS